MLEEETVRLRAVVKTRQDADDLAANHAKRQEIEREVERLRGLRFLRPVDYREIPRTELPAILRQKLAQQVPDQEFDDAGVALAALGILPAGTDLKKTYLALLGEQIGAFYDQHEKQLFTFSGQPLSNSQNQVIMAHELTHALEDQHFDLSKLPIEARGNDDRVLAATALVEGDATLVMNQYMVGGLSAASVRDALASTLTTDVRQLASAPRYLRNTLLFPYLCGQEFCGKLWAHGGWDALAEAFRHPPASSSQVLHPELYLANPREDPVEIKFADDLVVAGQKPVEDNVLGEFGARQLFLNWLHDKARTEEAASGWRGDRYLVYRQDKEVSYVWVTACRDRAAAKRFFAAVSDVNAARYRLTQTRLEEPAPFPGDQHVLYSGRVQGGGFRYSVKQLATGFDVTGWVRNLPDGTVEVQANGEPAEVEAFVAAIAASHLGGYIKDASQSDLEAAAESGRGFEIRH